MAARSLWSSREGSAGVWVYAFDCGAPPQPCHFVATSHSCSQCDCHRSPAASCRVPQPRPEIASCCSCIFFFSILLLGFTNNADYANAFGDDGTLAAARLREILECIGLSQENLSQSGVMAAQTLANVAHLLDVKDTETSRYVCFSLEHLLILQTTSFDSNAWSLEWEFFFLGLTFLLGSAIVAMTELSLKKIDVEEKRTKVQKESKLLLDNTRKAIARLTYLKRWVLQHALW